MGQVNIWQSVLLLNMTQYKKCRVLKINMRIPFQNSITQCVIVLYDTTQKMYSIKNKYAQVHIGTQPLAKYFLIPLRNDQGHRDMKYHRNTKEKNLYRHILMEIGIVMVEGFVILVKT